MVCLRSRVLADLPLPSHYKLNLSPPPPGPSDAPHLLWAPTLAAHLAPSTQMFLQNTATKITSLCCLSGDAIYLSKSAQQLLYQCELSAYCSLLPLSDHACIFPLFPHFVLCSCSCLSHSLTQKFSALSQLSTAPYSLYLYMHFQLLPPKSPLQPFFCSLQYKIPPGATSSLAEEGPAGSVQDSSHPSTCSLVLKSLSLALGWPVLTTE